MASMRTHFRATKGFCLCHLLCVWRITGKLCTYLGYYHASYVPQRCSFVLDDQLYVQLMAIVNGFCILGYWWFAQRWIYDQLLLLLYAPLYIYFFQLRQHIAQLLNECAKIHQRFQALLGSWLCVSLRKGSVLTLLLPLELLLLLVWQYHMYYGYQFCFLAGLSFIYLLQLVWLGNYLIWLASIYRALNEFLLHHMSSYRMGTLKGILRQESRIWRLHFRITRYFVLHLLSFLTLIVSHSCRLYLGRINNHQLHIDRLQLVHLMLLLSLLITLLAAACELQQQRRHFHCNYLRLEDRIEYFQLKSWGLLKHQTLPMPFGLPLVRSFARPQHKRDIITIKLPAPKLRQSALPLVSIGLGHHRVQLPLPPLLSMLKQLGFILLLPLYVQLLNSQLRVTFYNPLTSGYSNANVTGTISQVFRFYVYDELE
ncbi:uncharacterized protein LOC132788262 [Drosophila nasuta]|uniref:uncharacterized protein LOC132788262 n=1 Tax=Drosophila nasuta TaxID=42062 RepID=UPI00295E21F2|nr:uncharacterized protein LOC132788262 [Drosophila nasuta]